MRKGRDLSQSSYSSRHKRDQVHFLSDTLQHNELQVSGWLRKTTRREKVLASAQFPLRFAVLSVAQNSLLIMHRPGGTVEIELKLSELVAVHQYVTPSSELEVPQDFIQPFLLCFESESLLFWAKTPTE